MVAASLSAASLPSKPNPSPGGPGGPVLVVRLVLGAGLFQVEDDEGEERGEVDAEELLVCGW